MSFEFTFGKADAVDVIEVSAVVKEDAAVDADESVNGGQQR